MKNAFPVHKPSILGGATAKCTHLEFNIGLMQDTDISTKTKGGAQCSKIVAEEYQEKNNITSALYAIKNLYETEGLAQLNVSGLRWILPYK